MYDNQTGAVNEEWNYLSGIVRMALLLFVGGLFLWSGSKYDNIATAMGTMMILVQIFGAVFVVAGLWKLMELLLGRKVT